ncbi:MAG: hypothetical protein H0U46_02655 [Actinobacteria bacterium]|nr:hypothetical protein [Actinomycetota bacterium]
MKWLLTISTGVDLDELSRELARHGISVDVDSCVPLDAGEQVVEAEGPAELHPQLELERLGVRKASPSSELELFEPADEEDADEAEERGPGR